MEYSKYIFLKAFLIYRPFFRIKIFLIRNYASIVIQLLTIVTIIVLYICTYLKYSRQKNIMPLILTEFVAEQSALKLDKRIKVQ